MKTYRSVAIMDCETPGFTPSHSRFGPMTNGLYRLIYFSRNRVGRSSEDFEQAVRNILSVARRKNAQAGVTGALMYNSGCFVQILEGERANVQKIYELVRRDERHSDVTLLGFEAVAERGFGHWSMAFVGAKESDLARHGVIAEESGFDPSRMSGQAIFEFLHRLAHEREEKGEKEEEMDSESQQAFG
ncbi:BLUF domain-containing protein [Rhodoblastus sphagnicola]|nr:BLUF domain-containing protein [Rhodoblastus sphagnicola]